jgi:hypothetical protein
MSISNALNKEITKRVAGPTWINKINYHECGKRIKSIEAHDWQGRKYYFDGKGQLHREDGPAIISPNGEKEWWLNGVRHREDGPAIEYANGDKEWWINGQLHRDDGPAVEYANGDKYWYKNGLHHRNDGPAVEWADGDKAWYKNGLFQQLEEKILIS